MPGAPAPEAPQSQPDEGLPAVGGAPASPAPASSPAEASAPASMASDTFVVTSTRVPRPPVAWWNAGAREAAMGSKSVSAELTCAALSAAPTIRMMPSSKDFGDEDTSGERAPFAVITSSMVSERRVAGTVNGVVPNHGKDVAL